MKELTGLSEALSPLGLCLDDWGAVQLVDPKGHDRVDWKKIALAVKQAQWTRELRELEAVRTSIDLLAMSPSPLARAVAATMARPIGDRIDTLLREMGQTASDEGISRIELAGGIRSVESTMETVRNERQQLSSSFENFDQKASQYVNLLSTVLKSLNEMRSALIRNLL